MLDRLMAFLHAGPVSIPLYIITSGGNIPVEQVFPVYPMNMEICRIQGNNPK
jgi:hypothetical protein